MRSPILAPALFALLLAMAAATSSAATPPPARTAILCAFEPELKALVGLVKDPQTHAVAGTQVVSGTLEGQPVLLVMIDIGMVNAALNTQMLIDRFPVGRIVFSGIAGGLDPDLSIGDVIVPDRWVESLETVMARRTPKGFEAPDWMTGMTPVPGYGMMLPRGVRVGSAHHADEFHDAFTVDPGLFAIAKRALGGLTLQSCTANHVCLDKKPRLVIGGTGLTSPAFVDNDDQGK